MLRDCSDKEHNRRNGWNAARVEADLRRAAACARTARVLPWLLWPVAALVSGCGTGHWVREPVEDERYHSVFIEHREVAERPVEQGFAHPSEIDEGKIHVLLAHLSYVDKPFLRSARNIPVFTEEEIKIITPLFRRGLAKAAPHQWVRFRSTKAVEGFILPAQRVTTGVVFVRPEGIINIAFDRLDEPVDTADNRTLYSTDPTMWSSSSARLARVDWQDVYRDPLRGDVHALWVVVRVDRIPDGGEEAKGLETKKGAVPPPAETQ